MIRPLRDTTQDNWRGTGRQEMYDVSITNLNKTNDAKIRVFQTPLIRSLLTIPLSKVLTRKKNIFFNHRVKHQYKS